MVTIRNIQNYFFIFLFLLIISKNGNISCYSYIPCGDPKPSRESDCLISSNSTHACCYFEFIDRSGCALYDSRYNGRMTYGALSIVCSGGNVIYSTSVVIFIIFLLF
jgi:hypothetical protein